MKETGEILHSSVKGVTIRPKINSKITMMAQTTTRILLKIIVTSSMIIILKGTNYKKLKSYQFFFEGNIKWLENRTYIKASVLPSMTKTPYRVLIKFTPQCDILRAACTCLAGLGSQGKGKCNHIGGVLFAFKMLQDEVCRKTPRTTFLHMASFRMGRSMQ